ncbi:class I SAM-dependent methyltransferase [Acidisphaera sp. L21]|uniref:class I SAM-dependent DNA methyltransferase n=1 Tax=Acidisphaera sp. L21 TaxID=1641851 RepID=UPI00131BCFAC|nr:SAM-dependent methyltransferase [Acidisphaera sp. L21]
MSRWTEPVSQTWLEQLYTADPDPWNFTNSDYERAKYAATLGALPPGKFANALEIGCSIGVFTRQLAERCGTLRAIDASEAALVKAREHCPGVQFERRFIPGEWPQGRYDLIMFSEILYFLDRAAISATAKLALTDLQPGGVILLVNYLGAMSFPCTGDEAAELFIEMTGLTPALQIRETDYRLDRLDHPG